MPVNRDRYLFNKAISSNTIVKAKAEWERATTAADVAGLRVDAKDGMTMEILLNALMVWAGQVVRRKGAEGGPEGLRAALKDAFAELNRMLNEDLASRPPQVAIPEEPGIKHPRKKRKPGRGTGLAHPRTG